MKKLEISKSQTFPCVHTYTQKQYVETPDNWNELVQSYQELADRVLSARTIEMKDNAKQYIIVKITLLVSQYGKNSKIMGIAKLIKKYRKLLTMFRPIYKHSTPSWMPTLIKTI